MEQAGKRKVWKRVWAFVLSVALIFGLSPENSFVAHAQEEGEACICTELCTEGSVNADCPVCAAEGADIGLCEGTEVTEPDEIEPEKTESEEPGSKAANSETADKIITAWQWVDEEEILDPETGSLALPGASKDVPALFADVTNLLPTEIKAVLKVTVQNGEPAPTDNEGDETAADRGEAAVEEMEQTLALGGWECEDYPEAGAYSGRYFFTASIPEGYVLAEGVRPFTVPLELGGSEMYANEASYNISTGDIVIDDSCGDNCQGHIITGDTTEHKVVIESGEHNITLNNLNIQFDNGSGGFNDTSGTCAFDIQGSARVNITLQGANVLKSGLGKAGLQVANGAELVITANSAGSLEAFSKKYAAGIGGSVGGTGGTITINGGTITAESGGYGCGIGGGNDSSGGSITISGGFVTAVGKNDNAAIGCHKNHTSGNFSTGTNGHAVIVALADGATEPIIPSDSSGWQGIINDVVRGCVTVDSDYTISSQKTWVIPAGSTLEIPENVTLTNCGMIEIQENGSLIIQGTIVNKGSIYGNGTVVQENSGMVQQETPASDPSADVSESSSVYIRTLEDKFEGTKKQYSVDGINYTTYTGRVLLTGTTDKNNVVIQSGTHEITLSDVNIDVSDDGKSAIELEGNAAVSLTLEGTNVLRSANEHAGIRVENRTDDLNDTDHTASLTINGPGSLEVHGGENGAGIGGNNGWEERIGGHGGIIHIQSGTVKAYGGEYGAGIGGGSGGSGGNRITISGGIVVATGGHDGAGIGGGSNYDGLFTGGKITIIGGVVTAVAGKNANSIGGGSSATGKGDVVIDGGVVNATTIDNVNNNQWNGIVNNTVKGNCILKFDYTNPSDTILTVPAGAALAISENVNLTNNGTINIESGGKLILDGKIIGSGQIGSSDSGNIEYKLMVVGKHTVKINGSVAEAVSENTDTSIYYVAAGANVSITVNEPEGKKISTWTVSGIDGISSDALKRSLLTFTMPSNAVTINAEYKNAVTIMSTTDAAKLTQTYDGTAIDVSELFTIGTGGGAPTYTLVTGAEGGNGEGSIAEDTSQLTVTKVGTFVIKVTTAETEEYAAGEKTVTLTVEQADGTVSNKDEGGYATSYIFSDTQISAPVADNFTTTNSGGTFTFTWYQGAEVTEANRLSEGESPSAIGTYSLKVDVAGTTNYKAASCIVLVAIHAYDTNEKVELSGTQGNDGWYTGDVTITAPAGFKISTSQTKDSFIGNTLTISEDMNGNYTYYLMNDAGYITAAREIEVKRDTVDPTGSITIKNNSWTQFLNQVTFGWFFNKTTDVTITAEDTGSAVAKVEYLLSASSFESADAVDGTWTGLDKSLDGRYHFSITPGQKGSVYVRVTDTAGRSTVMNSEGVVVYTDAAQADTSISHTRLSTEDRVFTVTLNGNTINQVTISSTGETTLTQPVKNTDYTILVNQVTMDADYLNTLPAGDYTITVSYNPLGETYVSASESGGADLNDAPVPTTVNLTVEKADGMVTIEGNPGKTYDGTQVTTQYTTNNATGTVVIQYKVQGADDSTYTTDAPKNVGDYTVRVTVQEDAEGNYTEAVSAPVNFTISRKEVIIEGTTVEASRVYDGTTGAVITDNGTLSANYDGENLSFTAGTASYENKNAGKDKAVTFSGFALAGTAKDNYTLSAQPAATTADITAKELTVNVAVSDKQYDGLDTAEIKGTPSLNGVVDGDQVILTNGIPTFTTVEAGENIPVRFTDFSISGDDAGNYTLTQPGGVTANITNSYEVARGTEYSVNSNEWINTDFVITANVGYELSENNTANGTWSSTLTASNEIAEGSLTFYVRNKMTGAISKQVTESYKIDKTAPDGDIKIKENSIKSILNVITFGLFFKKKVDVTITAVDEGAAPSGNCTIDYQKVAEGETYDENGTWTSGDRLSVTENEAFVLYARITDKAGNTTIINSDGVVVYTDAAQKTADITYTRTTKADATAEVTLNGNTIDKVTISSAGNVASTAELTKDRDYTVNEAGDQIAFKEDYLESLIAGDYTITVSYNPLGKKYQ
ncbi:MAG: YDG domain-containing protein, partial [Lachnospiraceae bacterium]|nr:YDG domain-containing protein [Lachnospiraceae bacterium]